MKFSKYTAFPVFLALTLAAFGPSLLGGFIWDDLDFVISNPAIRESSSIFPFWVSKSTADYWPVSYSFFWMLFRFFGESPLGYHTVQFFIHSLNSFLLWACLRKMNTAPAIQTLAGPVAILFCVHPLNTESIAWIFQIKTTLATFFTFSSFWLLLRWRESGLKKIYGAAWLLFTLGLLAKISAVTWPVFLSALLFLEKSKWEWKNQIKLIPFWLSSLVLGVVNLLWYKDPFPSVLSEAVREDSFWTRLAGSGYSFGFYLTKTVWPHPLIFNYPRWDFQVTDAGTWFPLTLVLSASAAIWLRGSPLLRGAWIYSIVTLFPVMGFFNIYYMRFSFVADHWAYLALPGLLLVALETVRRIPRGPQWITVLGAAFFIPLSFQHSLNFETEEKLMTDTLEKNPAAWMAHNNLAEIHKREWLSAQKASDFEKSVFHFHESLKINPNASAFYNLGVLLYQSGQIEKARDAFQNSAKLNPRSAVTHNNLGLTELQMDRVAPAKESFLSALRWDPELDTAIFNLSLIFEKEGDREKALFLAERAYRLRPENPAYRHRFESLQRPASGLPQMPR